MQSPYDPALRAEIRQRMSPPNRESVAEIARTTGVNAQTLYSWRHLSTDIENWTSAVLDVG
jgi:transposase-like protein